MKVMFTLFWSICLVYAANRASTQNVYSRYRCGVPNVIPDVPIVPEQYLGIWYFYRSNYGINSVNGWMSIDMIGNDFAPYVNQRAVSQVVKVVWTDLTTPKYPNCFMQPWVGKVIPNGAFQGLEWVLNKEPPVEGFYQTLAFEADLFHIKYFCAKRNLKTGTCDQPLFDAHTRRRWNQLDANTLYNLDQKLNAALAPFCMSIQDLPQATQEDPSKDCPAAPLPSCMHDIIRGYQVAASSS